MSEMAGSDEDSRSEVSEILASCDNTSPKKKEPDEEPDPFEGLSPIPSDIEEEDVRQVVVGKSSKSSTTKFSYGRAWKNEDGEYKRFRCYDYNTEYKAGDSVFIETQKSDQPFYICNITEFKKSKRDNLMVCIRWFYRTAEVPEQVYNMLIQDRHSEQNGKGQDQRIKDPLVKSRELFISDATDQYPVNVLRGKCTVQHCADISECRKFEPKDDAFYYTLSYNPETRRLASTQGEIRVGPSHQAKLPPFEGDVPPIGRPDRYEELTWEPGRTHDHDLLMYLRAARSMAAFAGMCDGGSTDDGCFAASRDDTTRNALDMLHDCDYNTGQALQLLVKNPVPQGQSGSPVQWSEDETRRFIKGLRTYGKNFFKIRTELLPEKETGEIITFYYLWKKTPGAANNRPRGRRHRPSVLRRVKSKENKENGKDKDKPAKDTSSASEAEDSGDEGKYQNPYHCRHCLATTSQDWHHAGKDMKLLCTNCRLYFKRYGELPLLPGMVRSQFTFRPISPSRTQEDEDSVSDRGLDNRLSPASDRGREDMGEESDSGRSYSSRSRSESRSGSRTPEEEDMSRATTPGTGAEADGNTQENIEPAAPATTGSGPSLTDIERDIDDESDTPPPVHQINGLSNDIALEDIKAEEQDDSKEDINSLVSNTNDSTMTSMETELTPKEEEIVELKQEEDDIVEEIPPPITQQIPMSYSEPPQASQYPGFPAPYPYQPGQPGAIKLSQTPPPGTSGAPPMSPTNLSIRGPSSSPYHPPPGAASNYLPPPGAPSNYHPPAGASSPYPPPPGATSSYPPPPGAPPSSYHPPSGASSPYHPPPGAPSYHPPSGAPSPYPPPPGAIMPQSSPMTGLPQTSPMIIPQTSPMIIPQTSPMLSSGTRTPVDLTCPSPTLTPGPPVPTTPQPDEVQVLEPDVETSPSSPAASRPPTPEPRIEDAECHRSQSAIFVRHWNRGEGNSCSRTDLYFKPVPDSKLARKREERLRKRNEKEERDRMTIKEPGARNDPGPARSPLSRLGIPPGAGMSPGLGIARTMPSSMGMSMTPPTSSMYSSLHDRMEIDRMEKEKRDREMAELRDRENRMRDEMLRRGALGMPRMATDPYLEASRRYAAVAGLSSPFGMGPGERLSAERLAAERMALSTDPLVRLQMAGISPEVSAHTHTHLHINPSDPAAAAFMLGQPPGMGFPPGALGRPGMPPGYGTAFDPRLRSPAADYLSRFAHPSQLMGQQQDALQRQLMYERERGLLGGPGGHHLLSQGLGGGLSSPGAGLPSLQQLQHEEFIRAARDREMKVRTLEEAARQAGGGPR